VLRAVDVQHLAEARPRLAPPPMLAARSLLAHQPSLLESRLHEAVRQLDPMLTHRQLVEVAHVEVQVPLPVQAQHPLDLSERRPAWRRSALPAIP
jgi:hypothetical protein